MSSSETGNTPNSNPAANVGQSISEPKSNAELQRELECDGYVRRKFFEYLKEYGVGRFRYGWLRDIDGRFFCYKEQWEFDPDQLGKFLDFLDKHQHEYFAGWCRWCGRHE
jgi:hypothetical protein